jgi:hypothetical protein
MRMEKGSIIISLAAPARESSIRRTVWREISCPSEAVGDPDDGHRLGAQAAIVQFHQYLACGHQIPDEPYLSADGSVPDVQIRTRLACQSRSESTNCEGSTGLNELDCSRPLIRLQPADLVRELLTPPDDVSEL